MTKKAQIKGFEETINNIPLVIDPCKMCEHNKNKGKRKIKYRAEKSAFLMGIKASDFIELLGEIKK